MTKEKQTPSTTFGDLPHANLDEEILREEFELFSRYLVGEVAGPDFEDRYVEACQKRLTDCPPSPYIDGLMKRKWMIGPVDAALGLTAPGDEIRRKLLITIAVLEASPDYCHLFLSQQTSLPQIILRLAWIGLTSILKCVIGLVILSVIQRETHLAPKELP